MDVSASETHTTFNVIVITCVMVMFILYQVFVIASRFTFTTGCGVGANYAYPVSEDNFFKGAKLFVGTP